MSKLDGLSFRDNQVLRVDKLLQAEDFDSLEDLKKLYPTMGGHIIFATPEAWDKYESLLFTPEYLKKLESYKP